MWLLTDAVAAVYELTGDDAKQQCAMCDQRPLTDECGQLQVDAAAASLTSLHSSRWYGDARHTGVITRRKVRLRVILYIHTILSKSNLNKLSVGYYLSLIHI